MGDYLSSKLNTFLLPCTRLHCCIGLVFNEFQRELQLMERERALVELERG
jgi:hypothetical protein